MSRTFADSGAINRYNGDHIRPSLPGRFNMIDAPGLTNTNQQFTAVIHLTVPRPEIQDVMGPAIREVMATIAAQGIAPIGPVFSRHLKIDPEIFDFEVGVPVAKPVAAAGRVKPSSLPAARVARTVYRGPYEGLGAAWGEFERWLAAHGHTAAANLWEIYAAGPESSSDSKNWRTELIRPLIQ
jgi:effector-binding domain-containing protein